MIATKLAHYEITNRLGSSGMGEMYQATDSKLGAECNDQAAARSIRSDADRAARFERARALASLNQSKMRQLTASKNPADGTSS